MIEEKAKNHEHLQKEWRNPYMQWYAAGMPAYVTKDLSPYKQLIVKFKTMEDRNAFAELVEQKITEKTNVIWIPMKERENNIDSKWIEDDV